MVATEGAEGAEVVGIEMEATEEEVLCESSGQFCAVAMTALTPSAT